MGTMAEFETLPRTRCFLSFMMLLLFLPITLAYAFVAWVFNIAQISQRRPVAADAPVVMLTGGKMAKSLHFARWFWKAGYRVVMVETEKYWLVGSRWSAAVTAFETVPCPRTDPEGYIDGLVRVAQKHGANFFVPVSSPAAAISDSAAKPRLERAGCRVLHFDLDMCHKLDNKHEFCNMVRDLDLTAPQSFNVDSEETAKQLNLELAQASTGVKYVLKNLEYDPIHRLDMFLLPCPEQQLVDYMRKVRIDGNPIQPSSPWQLQQFIKGVEYTSFAVLREGQVRAITTAESSPSQLNYEHVEIKDITDWMHQFAHKTQLTGQLCMDFIKDAHTGVSYPIECNPRVHSQCVTFLDDVAFGDAVLADKFSKTLLPSPGMPPVFWLYNELLKTFPDSVFNYGQSGMLSFLSRLLTEREADFDPEDPLPFLMRNHFQLPGLLWGTMVQGTPWKKLDFCIGKVVELNGD